MSGSPQTQELDERLGEVIGGRYRLDARLGEGGMGTVYRAEHLELGRPVAIKLLIHELARNRNAVERFLREARTASAIGHPNIVDVFDLGRDANGAPFLAMELLEGHDLLDELRESDEPMDPARVLEILRPIASALDVCHARGVVHRDLKPSNVFLAQLLDGTEQPKLVDFGLAMLLATDERLTRTGFFAGTPEYMSPESARGELSGPAGDIYALATMTYEMLSGRVPFEAEMPNGVLVQKIADDPPRMGTRSGRSFPPEVEDAVAHGLAMEPEDRPGSAAGFVDALARALEDAGPVPIGAPRRERSTSAETPRARVTPPRESTERPIEGRPSAPPTPPMQRSPVVWAVAAAALLVLAPAAWWLTRDPPEPTDPEPARDEGAVEPEAPPEPATIADTETTPEGVEAPIEPPPEPERGDEAIEESPTTAPSGRRRRSPSTEEPPEASGAAGSAGETAPPDPPRDRAAAVQRVRAASSLLIRGDHAGALRLLDRARAADPSYPAIYRTSGLAHERAGRAAAARRDYERYLQMAPGAADASRIRQRLERL